jgi:hypothetical protein
MAVPLSPTAVVEVFRPVKGKLVGFVVIADVNVRVAPRQASKVHQRLLALKIGFVRSDIVGDDDQENRNAIPPPFLQEPLQIRPLSSGIWPIAMPLESFGLFGDDLSGNDLPSDVFLGFNEILCRTKVLILRRPHPSDDIKQEILDILLVAEKQTGGGSVPPCSRCLAFASSL